MMKNTIRYIALLLMFFSCRDSEESSKPENIRSAQIFDDSYVVGKDTTFINHNRFIAFYTYDNKMYILDHYGDTVFTQHELNHGMTGVEFLNFDRDQYEDLMIFYISNVADIRELLLFDINSNSYKFVERFIEFPAPIKIGNSKYYYSYRKSGCQDYNWDSDLFYIQNFTAIRIANISGRGCYEGEEKTGIFISAGRDKNLFSIEEIIREPGYYDDKFEFIKEYWEKNYKKFECYSAD